MKKFGKILLIILASLLSLLLLAWGGYAVYRTVAYADYLSDVKRECKIPDLNSGFTPQGITYVESENTFLFSGYDGEHLALYRVSGDHAVKLIPLDETGTPGTGHGGGITHAGEYVYIAGDSALLAYKLSDILSAEENEIIPCSALVDVNNDASFCFADNGFLFVGEFYRAGNYETDLSHAYTTPEGEENRAIVTAYPLNENGTFAGTIPYAVISIPGLVQGFAITDDGEIAISRSWALADSSIEFYDSILPTDQTMTIEGQNIPLYYIGQKNLVKTVKAPFFSEDLAVKDGRLLVSYESACNKYILGKFYFSTSAESIPFAR